MAFRDAFIIRRVVVAETEKGSAVAVKAAENGPSEGVFLSSKSLLSFPVASGVVSFLWKLYQHFWGGTDIVVLWLSLLVGVFIFLIVVSDPGARPKNGIAWVIAIVLAILNSLFLAASSLGLVKDVFGQSGNAT